MFHYINHYHVVFVSESKLPFPPTLPTICRGVRGHQHARDESIQVPHSDNHPKRYSHPQDHAYSGAHEAQTTTDKSSVHREVDGRNINFDGLNGFDSHRNHTQDSYRRGVES